MPSPRRHLYVLDAPFYQRAARRGGNNVWRNGVRRIHVMTTNDGIRHSSRNVTDDVASRRSLNNQCRAS